MVSDETHPFKCRFCTSKFQLMHEAQFHFVNQHQKKLEAPNPKPVVPKPVIEKKISQIKQEPGSKRLEPEIDDVSGMFISNLCTCNKET